MNDISFLSDRADVVAPRLLGCILRRKLDGEWVSAKIVETEAYDESDVASHSYNGQTDRTKVMFGPSGHLYVYFTYGMHYCCNIVVGDDGRGSAVLIRAVEPIEGSQGIEERRGKKGVEATNGPAKLCQALGIDKSLNGHGLQSGELQLIAQPALEKSNITQTTRIGISRGQDTPWRFYITDNPYVSKK